MTSALSSKSLAHSAFKQVLVYDPSVQQVEVLLQGLDAGVDAIPITAGDEPMKTLEQLMNDPQLARLHVLGHGAPGEVILGGKRIDAQSFAHRQPSPRNESHSFQIAFWSCNTGHGEIGMNFLNTVANSTGANVYGSTGLVGHEDKGGSWQLDVHAAPQAPFSARAREGFRQVLVAPTLSGTAWTGIVFEEGVTTEPSSDPSTALGDPVLLFRTVAVGYGAGDSTSIQRIVGLKFTVSGVRDAGQEVVWFDGVPIVLAASATQNSLAIPDSAATMDWNWSVAYNATTDLYTVQITSSGIIASALRNALLLSSYQNQNVNDPTFGERTVSLISITDSGNTASTTDNETTTLSVPIKATVTVRPVNDAPQVISQAISPELLVEGDAALLAQGSFQVMDPERADAQVLQASVSNLVVRGKGAAQLSSEDLSALKDMMQLSLSEYQVDSLQRTVSWAFASGAGKFDLLPEEVSLALSYTIDVLDSEGVSLAAPQTVTITITGTNDLPQVSALPPVELQEGSDLALVNLLAQATDADAGETATLAAVNAEFSVNEGPLNS